MKVIGSILSLVFLAFAVWLVVPFVILAVLLLPFWVGGFVLKECAFSKDMHPVTRLCLGSLFLGGFLGLIATHPDFNPKLADTLSPIGGFLALTFLFSAPLASIVERKGYLFYKPK